MRFRVTVIGEDMQLRGFMDGYQRLAEFSDAMKPYGLVIASPAEEDFNPFVRKVEDVVEEVP